MQSVTIAFQNKIKNCIYKPKLRILKMTSRLNVIDHN